MSGCSLKRVSSALFLAVMACFSAVAVAAPKVAHETVLSGLDNPWDMAFLPDGTMFFTEKCLGLSVRMPSGKINKLLGMKDSKGYAATASDLFCEGQAGMQGVAVDPDFSKNRQIYVWLLYHSPSPRD